MTGEDLPGTHAHQAMLHAVAAYYAGDSRIRSVAVFGSLGRGNWDELSDLDLNVVVEDGVVVDVSAEVRRLCDALAAIGERAALIVPNGEDAADVVFESLAHLSIRYHLLAETSPNIVDSLFLLAGPLGAGEIQAAGLARRPDIHQALEPLLDACVRTALYVDIQLQRGDLWLAIWQMHRMRELVIELFATARGGARAYRTFEAEAGEALKQALGATLPQYDAESIAMALARMLDLLDGEIEGITSGRLRLSDGQRAVIAGVRARQVALAHRQME